MPRIVPDCPCLNEINAEIRKKWTTSFFVTAILDGVSLDMDVFAYCLPHVDKQPVMEAIIEKRTLATIGGHLPEAQGGGFRQDRNSA